jgi:hypothetical protein
MKLYATTTSDRASKGQGGNEYIRITLQSDRKKEDFVIVYTPDSLRVCASTEDGGALLYEVDKEKGKQQKGEIVDDDFFDRMRAERKRARQ